MRQYDFAGEPTVRWVSRSEVPDQSADLFRPAFFEGASDDGRNVFFRADQPLTEDDPNGAGAPPPAGGVTSGSASRNSWDLYRYELPQSADDDPTGPEAGGLTRITGGPSGEFTPWSANEPSDSVVVQKPEFAVASGPGGAGCPPSPAARPFGLGFAAGVSGRQAGGHSVFNMRLVRPDGAQELERLELTAPEGFAADISEVPYCPEAGIARAAARDGAGQGAVEPSDPSCPAASRGRHDQGRRGRRRRAVLRGR